MEKKYNRIKRGNIYYCKLNTGIGSVQTGVRPVLIIQNDIGNDNGTTTIVASITTIIKKRYLPTHVYLGCNFGLKSPSMVMLEQIHTVDKSEIDGYVGALDNYTLRKIDKAIINSLGIIGDIGGTQYE